MDSDTTTNRTAMVDESGKFHCPCGRTHRRGPMPQETNVYRCLGCGSMFRVSGVAELRTTTDALAKLRAQQGGKHGQV